MTMRLFIICLIVGASSAAQGASAAIRAGLGVLERSGGPDVMPRVGASARLMSGLQLHAQLGANFTNIKAADHSNSGDHVYEWQALVGFGWRLVAQEDYYIDIAAIAGPLFRQYPDHIHTDPAGELPFTFGIRIVDGVAVELRVAPGFERPVTVMTPTGTWHRGNIMLEAGAMLAYDFDPFAGAYRHVDF